jgi:CBS domain-containing protein
MSNSDPHSPRVGDVMTPEPTVVHPDDEAQLLLALFEGRDFNALPVVDPAGHLLGMVTKLSLLRLFRGMSTPGNTDPLAPSSLRVRDIMDTRKVWVEPADGLDVVVRHMTRHRVRSVPVVERSADHRRLVGMVSRGDLLRGFRKPPE